VKDSGLVLAKSIGSRHVFTEHRFESNGPANQLARAQVVEHVIQPAVRHLTEYSVR
jgi:hypothetical protein